ncbi:MAG: 16S rRNA (uracil(1498)-N(3))-methyltransferase [Flavobacteriales bacterium]|nr:16S rRNA (uracil(1498)-N(3))-methyltransferase [Flavobacteriales bacterium]
MDLFHCPHLHEPEVRLPDEEAHHAVHVLRLKPGDRIGLLDGRGTRATAELIVADKHGARATILDRVLEGPERKARIHLAVAPTKQQDRIEWLVEKAVETGVDRITPLLTRRTERDRLRTDRLLRVAIAAMKQSRRAWLPTIDAPLALDVLLREELPAQRYFGRCEGDRATLMERYDPAADALVLIGPEGDFTTEEAELMEQTGFTAISIGSARLRTETAALAACVWMGLAQQR